MQNLLNTSLDQNLLNVSGLTWLPWIGREYINNQRRLLIVGESHYAIGGSDEEYQKRFHAATNDPNHTRDCIYESPICGDWQNNTFDNIHRVFLRTNDFDKEKFWEQVAYYNFIPRLMDYRSRERPTWVDFYSSWKTFVEVVKILKPTDCVFIGVSAANSFNLAMEELRLTFEPVKLQDSIGAAYPRTAQFNIDDQVLKLSFIQHASQHFSWSNWNEFLVRENSEIITFLSEKILGAVQIPGEVIPATKDQAPAIDVPMHLAHKPIIACNYAQYTNEEDDAKFLSIGHAQYDHAYASAKIFRHTGDQWSRQSEELPINRVGDLALLLLTTINKVYNPEAGKSILNEAVITEDELEFLKEEIEENKERIKASFMEIRRILNEFDIQGI